jgi:predicted molibdopterin-dependent oxidoreductase YjgC
LFLFLTFCREALGVGRPGMVVPQWEPDDLLIKEEKAPNAAGARALGIGDADDVRATLARCERGEIDALVVLGSDLLLADDRDRVLAALAKVGTIVCLDTHESDVSRIAHVVLPAQGFAEKDGTMTNGKGRVQRIRPAIRPVGEAKAEWEIVSLLAARMGNAFPFASPAEILKELAERTPSFRGITLENVGSQGVPLAGA